MVLEIGLPVAVFTVVVLSLTIMVLAARHSLEPGGTVSIALNGRQAVEVPAGARLLEALAGHDIYLPAACGGRGTCGQCRVRVTSGASFAAPADELHISQADLSSGMRLACMLKVREPLAVDVPTDVLSVQRFEGVVTSNRSVATYLKELTLELDEPIDFEAGDYVLIEAPPHRLRFEDIDIGAPFTARWEESGLYDLKSIVRDSATRAYSLANPPQDDRHVVLVVKIALPPPGTPSGTPPGAVSSWLFGLKPGDRVPVRGPFGDFHARDGNGEMVLIGGGAGVSPLRSILLDLLGKRSRRRISLWYGARGHDELCYVDEFEAAAADHENFTYHVALSNEDPASDWPGHRGFIHSVVFDRYLKTHPDPSAVEYYLCGPPLMSAAVLKMLAELSVPEKQIFLDDFGV